MSADRFYLRTCRVCGDRKGVYTNLMDEKNKPYLKQIHRLLPIRIKKNDSLPKNICHSCIALLAEFEDIRNKCKTVEDKLISTAERFKSKEEIVKKPFKSRIKGESMTKISTATYLRKRKMYEYESRKEIDTTVIKKPKKNIPTTTAPNPDDWTVSCIPASNTMLYICKKCSSILLTKDAMENHVCSIGDKVEKDHEPIEATDTDSWVVSRIPETDTTLYTCHKCSSILLAKKDADNHVCRSIKGNLVSDSFKSTTTITNNDTKCCEQLLKKRKNKIRRKSTIRGCAND